MSDQSNQSANSTIQAAQYVLLSIIITLIMASLFISIERPDMLVSFLFLFGAWAIDVMMKLMLKLSNETALADLSFVSFIFAVSQSIAQQPESSSPELLYTLIFILGLIWMGNLCISPGLANGNSSDRERPSIVFLSLLFATLSVIITMFVKFIE